MITFLGVFARKEGETIQRHARRLGGLLVARPQVSHIFFRHWQASNQGSPRALQPRELPRGCRCWRRESGVRAMPRSSSGSSSSPTAMGRAAAKR